MGNAITSSIQGRARSREARQRQMAKIHRSRRMKALYVHEQAQGIELHISYQQSTGLMSPPIKIIDARHRALIDEFMRGRG